MSRLFVGNFDFERQLAGAYAPSRTLARLNAELACVWLAVAEAGDVLLCPEPLPQSYLEAMVDLDCPRVRCVQNLKEAAQIAITEVVPWGWTAPIQQWARRQAVHYDEIAPASVAQVNSRRFSFAAESQRGCALPGAKAVASLEELVPGLNDLHDAGFSGWLLKANLGQAGRDRIRGEGVELDERALRWAASRLHRDGVIFLEPFVQAVAEAGVQWTIPRRGTPRLDAVVLLDSNVDGSYHRSRVLPGTAHHLDWQPAIDLQRQVLGDVQHCGYFGPVGIDAMRYRLPSGEIRLRPLQDINARWTMGRLALGWARRFSRYEGGSWIHQRHAPSAEAIPASPATLLGRPVEHRTWWVNGR